MPKDPIQGITPLQPVETGPRRQNSAAGTLQPGPSFQAFMAESTSRVHELQQGATAMIHEIESGGIRDVNDAVAAVRRARENLKTLQSLSGPMAARAAEAMARIGVKNGQ